MPAVSVQTAGKGFLRRRCHPLRTHDGRDSAAAAVFSVGNLPSEIERMATVSMSSNSPSHFCGQSTGTVTPGVRKCIADEAAAIFGSVDGVSIDA